MTSVPAILAFDTATSNCSIAITRGGWSDGQVDRQGQWGGPHAAGRRPAARCTGRWPAAQGQGHAEPDRPRPRRQGSPRPGRDGARAAAPWSGVPVGGWVVRAARQGGRGLGRASRHGSRRHPDRPGLAHRRELAGQPSPGTRLRTGNARPVGVDGRGIQRTRRLPARATGSLPV